MSEEDIAEARMIAALICTLGDMQLVDNVLTTYSRIKDDGVIPKARITLIRENFDHGEIKRAWFARDHNDSVYKDYDCSETMAEWYWNC